MRTWIYSKLTGSSELTDLLPGGVWPRTAMEQAKIRPFAIYATNGPLPQIMDADVTLAATTNLQLWVHDEPGDYLRIDAALLVARALLEGVYDADVIRVRWNGDSDDLRDDGLKTICRYSQYQLTHKT